MRSAQPASGRPTASHGPTGAVLDDASPDSSVRARLTRLPSISRLQGLDQHYGRAALVGALREAVEMERCVILAGNGSDDMEARILDRAWQRLAREDSRGLRPVLNLTGTVLHTNLGRAPLPDVAIRAVAAAARDAINLEYDLDSGRRGHRDIHLEPPICRLTGGEAATVVNNNAAAVLLVLNTLARRKEVIVSRGELVEIGGAFRVPDVMASAGAKLREVGTTNRTHPADYHSAITRRSAAIMKVHASNYRIVGFTADVPERELAAIAHEHGLPFIVDLGSGSLLDLARFGLPHEPTAEGIIAAGADLITFSGDKLLGGPQAGLIIGRRDLVARIRHNPLWRALRCDKMTIAALAAVLRLYGEPDRLVGELPVLRLLRRPKAEIEALAQSLSPSLKRALGSAVSVELVACRSQIGSGAMPVESLASAGLRLTPESRPNGSGLTASRLAALLRGLPLPVLGRVQSGSVVLDLRCLEDGRDLTAQLPALEQAVRAGAAG